MTVRHQGMTLVALGIRAAAAGAVLAICVPGYVSAKEMTPAIAKLLEAAKAEGELNLVWGSGVMSGAVGVKRFEAGFNEYFGTKIKFNFTPGVSFPGMAAKTAEELAAGKTAFSDVSISSTIAARLYFRKKVLMSVDWAALLPHVPRAVLEKITAPDKTQISILSHSPGIVYNTNFIKKDDAPRTMKDLLDPKWKGKIGTTPYAAGFGELGDHDQWGRDATLKFARMFNENVVGLMRCGDYDRLTSGEFWIFAISCSRRGQVRLQIAKGAPLAQSIPLDVLMVIYHNLGVPKHAAHPNTAKLFIAWLLTPEGQRVLYRNKGSDLHLLEGSQTKPILEAAQKAAGREFYDYTVHQVLGTKYPKLRPAVAKLFRTKK